jgi:hypothetical protein
MKRIYRIGDNFMRADNLPQALRYVAEKMFRESSRVASQDDMLYLAEHGLKVEEAAVRARRAKQEDTCDTPPCEGMDRN